MPPLPSTNFDVIVVGGGHAGIEAAHAAARLGCRSALVTLEPAAIGRLSCNPAMGGLGKGHVVREIDALGGLQALATDACGIQFRLLNRSKGPAVRAPRVQVDKDLYPDWMQATLARLETLTILGGEGAEILTHGGRVTGLVMEDGRCLACRALVLTTGTFLQGVLHCGLEQTVGGRVGERSAARLAESFLALGLETGRLKTGTPARIHRDSIDFSKCQIQPGDEPPPAMSLRGPGVRGVEQVPCYLTRTTPETHAVILANLDQSPMYTGRIEGVGPRYCPSIEDKCVRFPEKDTHQIFLEPETRHGVSWYPNGVSTSMPAEVQEAFLRTVPGLENVRFLRHGYAVEYTYVPPRQLRPTLEAKDIGGLFMAGQINGTSGYEEAAGQGILAGINAALAVKGEEPLLLRRDEAYLAVMVDDLLTKDHREPYRLFTSRAEYRLLLRCANADLRLAGHALRIGMITQAEHDRVAALAEALRAETDLLHRTPLIHAKVDWAVAEAEGFTRPSRTTNLAETLSRPEVSLDLFERAVRPLTPHPELGEWEERYRDLLEVEIKYEGYFAQQRRHVATARDREGMRLPMEWAYWDELKSLRHEARQALARFRPETLGQAGRLPGVNPSDVDIILVAMMKRKRAAQAAQRSAGASSGGSSKETVGVKGNVSESASQSPDGQAAFR